MKTLIKNGILIRVEEEKVDYGIDILIDGRRIIKIDRNINEEADKIIDATNKVVMPGLINTHSHIPMSIFRETLDGYITQDWLEQKIWPMEAKLTEEDVYYASYLSFLEMIKTGTTTANDMYFLTDGIIKAMEETKVRLQTTRFLISTSGVEKGLSFLNELNTLLTKYNNPNLTFNVGIHGLYTTTSEYVDKCIEFAKEKNLLIHMHFLENAKERIDIESYYHDNPVNILKNKFKDTKLVLGHGTMLTKEEIDKIKDLNVSIAHCPVSNLKLGCGIANIDYMKECGINVSLGTDGQGSGCNMDLFETMKLAALLQKGINQDPSKIKAFDVIKMATINGAKALGLDDKIGTIEVGKEADIIIINTDSILTKPTNNLVSELVYNIKGNDVETTIVAGEILMENKKLVNTKEQEIIENCERIINRIMI